MKRSWERSLLLTVAGTTALTAGRGTVGINSQTVRIDMVQYKMEVADISEELEEKFNAIHDNIRLSIDSPNDTMTILKTRFIRKDVPDTIETGGEINYPSFLNPNTLMNSDDYEELPTVDGSYLEIDKELEFVSKDSVYAVPYVVNAAGVFYDRGLLEERGRMVPTTQDEFTTLCRQIQEEEVLPMFFGFEDVWDCLAPWSATSVDLAPPNVCSLVNKGETTSMEQYQEVVERTLTLLELAQEDLFPYGYNDACMTSARGESAMFVIGSYVVSQIQLVNPDIDIDTFVFPASNQVEKNVFNSGINLQSCIVADSPNKEAAYEVLDFLLQDENARLYLDDQNAVSCKGGNFILPGMLDGVTSYVREGKMVNYRDHYYPTEMSVGAMVQTYLMDGDTDVFLEKSDREWQRYSWDLTIKVQNYERGQEKKVSEGGEEND